MHKHANFHDWLRQHKDYMKWKDDQDVNSDSSTESFFNSLDEDEAQELRDEYDAYCEEMDKSRSASRRDKDGY